MTLIVINFYIQNHNCAYGDNGGRKRKMVTMAMMMIMMIMMIMIIIIMMIMMMMMTYTNIRMGYVII